MDSWIYLVPWIKFCMDHSWPAFDSFDVVSVLVNMILYNTIQKGCGLCVIRG